MLRDHLFIYESKFSFFESKSEYLQLESAWEFFLGDTLKILTKSLVLFITFDLFKYIS